MFIPPGYANLQLGFRLSNGRPGLTACGFVAEALDPSDPGQIVGNFTTACDYAQNRCVDSVSLVVARLVIGTSDPSAPIVFEASGDEEGGNTDTGIQPGTALLLTKHTNLGGRKGRGRCYLPGLSEAAVDAGGNLTGDVSGMRTDAEKFWEDMTFGTPLEVPVLFHDDDTTPPSPITDFSMSSQVATQRRRLRP